ncbi:hypothetical protein LINPERHAP1_LOCUS17926 [Linum perenne]
MQFSPHIRLPNLVSFLAAVICKFRSMASSSSISDVERIMHKLKKREED